MDQEATNPEKVLVLGVWVAESTEERQGRRVGICGWHVYCTPLTATLQCDGHHSRVSVPCLEVQTSIRKGDRHCREGKERRHDTRTHRQELGVVVQHGMLYCASIAFFSRPESGVICMTDATSYVLLATKERERRRNEDERNL